MQGPAMLPAAIEPQGDGANSLCRSTAATFGSAFPHLVAYSTRIDPNWNALVMIASRLVTGTYLYPSGADATRVGRMITEKTKRQDRLENVLTSLENSLTALDALGCLTAAAAVDHAIIGVRTELARNQVCSDLEFDSGS